jgi:hypothetical protein
MVENRLKRLTSFVTKGKFKTPSQAYFVARTSAEENEAIDYRDSVLTEVSDRRGALGGADSLERWERLF